MATLFGTTPDYRRLLTVLHHGIPDRLPFFEAYTDPAVTLAALAGWPMTDSLPLDGNAEWDDYIRGQYYLGYDFVAPETHYGFTGVVRHQSTDETGAARNFLNVDQVAIPDRAAFERYPWPTPEQVDYSGLDYCAAHLPEGMGIVGVIGGGPLEWGMWMMGAERYCMTLYDDPELIGALVQHINAQQVAVCNAVASHPAVFAVAMGDDWGFRTQTFLPPAALREFIMPALKRLIDTAHAHGKPFILHSCGNLTEVMDDLISLGLDAKHSFDDVAMPVTTVKERWGERIALLGGIDVDMLCRADEETLRRYVRHTMACCAPGGGYAVGSGNSIANYIPPRSLHIMLEEAILFRNEGLRVNSCC
ncbi:MAG: uroporphyrinogen decarboxylase family protein [Armatimonadota bacterium]